MPDTLLETGLWDAGLWEVGLWQVGRTGAEAGPAGVLARPVDPGAILGLAAGRGRAEALAGLLEERYGVRPPLRPGHRSAGGVGFVGMGPGRWLVLGAARRPVAFEEELRAIVGGLGVVADQSDAYLLFQLSGPKARQALAKGVTVDLHPGAFRPGDAATTLVGHIGATLWQLDEAPSYRVAVTRSYARSFLDWLSQSAAEFGFERLPSARA